MKLLAFRRNVALDDLTQENIEWRYKEPEPEKLKEAETE